MIRTDRLLATLIDGRYKQIVLPATWIATITGAIAILQVNNLEMDIPFRVSNLLVGIFTIGYAWLLYFVIHPLAAQRPSLRWVIAILNGLGLALLAVSLPRGVNLATIFLAIITTMISAIFLGKWLTYIYLLSTGILTSIAYFTVPVVDTPWYAVLGTLVACAFINEIIAILTQTIFQRVERLEAINRVSRTIATTIEVDQVIPLVCASVQEALLADTYFVGLLNGDCLQLELFYDDGEFFPPIEIPVDNTLVGWVIKNRKSLLIHDLPNELPELGISALEMGKPKSSLSWLGTPIAVGKHLLGIMAVASYQRFAFDKADLELLENIAYQTALVIDNAYQYAEVERQARLDSLTQVYNRGQLMVHLQENAQYARTSQSPLSLIMLDVDYFKQYNDNYGHIAGDQALTRVVEVIRQYIRSSDILSRWGGEEFVILLPDTGGPQATQVAERIRMTLRTLTISTIDEETIPVPTVSQGIAVFSEVDSGEKLLDLADQRLYLAKGRGRDQIEPDASHWARLEATQRGATIR